MIFAIHTEMGEAWFREMMPLLKDKSTLYVGSRSGNLWLDREWKGLDVTYCTPLRYPEGCWDQLFVHQVPLTHGAKRTIGLIEMAKRFRVVIMRPVMPRDVVYLWSHLL
jgi:hypothetical protein